MWLVQDPRTGKIVNTHHRISEAAWLTAKTDSPEDQLDRRFRRRVSLVTGLTMERAEDVSFTSIALADNIQCGGKANKNGV